MQSPQGRVGQVRTVLTNPTYVQRSAGFRRVHMRKPNPDMSRFCLPTKSLRETSVAFRVVVGGWWGRGRGRLQERYVVQPGAGRMRAFAQACCRTIHAPDAVEPVNSSSMSSASFWGMQPTRMSRCTNVNPAASADSLGDSREAPACRGMLNNESCSV